MSVNFVHKWTIDHCNRLLRKDLLLSNPCLRSGNFGPFTLCLYPLGCSSEHGEFVSVEIKIDENYTALQRQIQCKVWIEDADKLIKFEKKFGFHKGFLRRDFISHVDLLTLENGLLKSGHQLTICCEIILEPDLQIKITSSHYTVPEPKLIAHRLSIEEFSLFYKKDDSGKYFLYTRRPECEFVETKQFSSAELGKFKLRFYPCAVNIENMCFEIKLIRLESGSKNWPHRTELLVGSVNLPEGVRRNINQEFKEDSFVFTIDQQQLRGDQVTFEAFIVSLEVDADADNWENNQTILQHLNLASIKAEHEEQMPTVLSAQTILIEKQVTAQNLADQFTNLTKSLNESIPVVAQQPVQQEAAIEQENSSELISEADTTTKIKCKLDETRNVLQEFNDKKIESGAMTQEDGATIITGFSKLLKADWNKIIQERTEGNDKKLLKKEYSRISIKIVKIENLKIGNSILNSGKIDIGNLNMTNSQTMNTIQEDAKSLSVSLNISAEIHSSKSEKDQAVHIVVKLMIEWLKQLTDALEKWSRIKAEKAIEKQKKIELKKQNAKNMEQMKQSSPIYISVEKIYRLFQRSPKNDIEQNNDNTTVVVKKSTEINWEIISWTRQCTRRSARVLTILILILFFPLGLLLLLFISIYWIFFNKRTWMVLSVLTTSAILGFIIYVIVITQFVRADPNSLTQNITITTTISPIFEPHN